MTDLTPTYVALRLADLDAAGAYDAAVAALRLAALDAADAHDAVVAYDAAVAAVADVAKVLS